VLDVSAEEGQVLRRQAVHVLQPARVGVLLPGAWEEAGLFSHVSCEQYIMLSCILYSNTVPGGFKICRRGLRGMRARDSASLSSRVGDVDQPSSTG